MAGLIRCVVLTLLISFHCFPRNHIVVCNGEANMTCLEDERLALLKFKQELKDPHGLLSSWSTGDCCAWIGVGCNKITGHVVKIDLRYDYNVISNWCLGGDINPSLLDLKHLNYLDLSFNDFEGIAIPDFIGMLSELSYLNLSNAGFGGTVLHRLGNLSRLQYLDLNSLYSSYDLNSDSLHWLSHLSSFLHLDMSSVNLRMLPDWFNAINMFPTLSELRLPNCQLQGILPTILPYSNLTSLTTIDLSNNQIRTMIPKWLFNISSLVHLHLEFNLLYGPIPDAFETMSSLRVLDLKGNNFSGGVPRSIGNLCNLKTLDLSYNNFSGDTFLLSDISFGCLSESLELLNLRENNMRGKLSDRVGKFDKLTVLDLGQNAFYGPIPVSLGNLSALHILYMNHNQFNGTIPETFGKISQLSVLDLCYNALEGVISEIHLANLSRLEELSLSGNNSLSGEIFNTDQSSFAALRILHLGNNNFSGEIPMALKSCNSLVALDLGINSFSGPIPFWIGKAMPLLRVLRLRSNKFQGVIPPQLSNLAKLQILDLADNYLSGLIPHCLANFSTMISLHNTVEGLVDDLHVKVQSATNNYGPSGYAESLQLVMKGR